MFVTIASPLAAARARSSSGQRACLMDDQLISAVANRGQELRKPAAGADRPVATLVLCLPGRGCSPRKGAPQRDPKGCRRTPCGSRRRSRDRRLCLHSKVPAHDFFPFDVRPFEDLFLFTPYHRARARESPPVWTRIPGSNLVPRRAGGNRSRPHEPFAVSPATLLPPPRHPHCAAPPEGSGSGPRTRARGSVPPGQRRRKPSAIPPGGTRSASPGGLRRVRGNL